MQSRIRLGSIIFGLCTVGSLAPHLDVQLLHHPVEKTEDRKAKADRYSRCLDPRPDAESK